MVNYIHNNNTNKAYIYYFVRTTRFWKKVDITWDFISLQRKTQTHRKQIWTITKWVLLCIMSGGGYGCLHWWLIWLIIEDFNIYMKICCFVFCRIQKFFCLVRLMMFNATFNNISVISWRSVLLVRETWVLGENHRHAASYWQNFIT